MMMMMTMMMMMMMTMMGQTLVYKSPDPATLLYGCQYDGRCKKNKELELELELALQVEPQLD